MNPRIRKILPWVGYPAFYLFSLVFFAYLSAPYERLKHAIAGGFNSADSPLRMEIDDLSWSFRFPGVSASGIRLIGEPPPDATTDGKPPEPPTYEIEDLFLRVSILPLIVGSVDVGFGADGLGGEIDGSFSDSDDEKAIYIEFEEVDPGQMPFLSGVVGLPMSGSLNGTVDIVLPEGKLSQAEGTIELEIENLTVGDGKAKIRGTIALPTLDAGTVLLRAEATEGRVKIEEFSANGPDLELVSEGNIRLMDSFDSSLVEMSLRFKFSDAYKNKNDMTRGLFGEPGSKMPGLFDLDPKNKRAKQKDGFYAWRLTGPIGRLDFQPAGAGGASARARATKRRTRGRVAQPRRPPRLSTQGPSRPEPRPPAIPPPQPPPPRPVMPPPPQEQPAPELTDEEEEELEEVDLEEEEGEEEAEEEEE